VNVTIDLGDTLEQGPALLRLPAMTDQEFYEFCRRNETLNVERNAEGDLILMAPSDAWTESRGGELLIDVGIWNRSLPTPGYVFGPAAGIKLPDGADRAPDVAWIARDRWEAIPQGERHPFPRIAPDFVAEVLSPSDSLAATRRKMEEYIANGVQLGWLIDRKRRKVYVYRPGQDVAELDDPALMAGDPELPGLVADMARVLERDIDE
jgi:Uma2 family endonuclease